MNKLEHKKTFAGLITLAAILLASLFFGVTKVDANPSYFSNSQSNTTATSSPFFLTVGTNATTTLAYDTGASISQVLNSAVLLQQFIGSSTSAVLTDRFEYSQNGQDWYSDNLIGSQAITGTTSQSIDISTSNSYKWTYATADIGGATSTQNNNPKIIEVVVPTRFVRVISTIVGANGAVWEQFIGIRQSN